MKKEILEQAKSLSEQIYRTTERLNGWKKATAFTADGVSVYISLTDGGQRAVGLSPAPDSFKVLQAVNVAYWETKLQELQQQFDAL